MKNHYKAELNKHLGSFLTEKRLETFNWVLGNRTRYLTVVLENIFQPHNASAVLRTCDCFGVQDVHIIENSNEYNVNPDVALGSAQWLNMYKYSKEENNTVQTIEHLRKKGYRIVATTPHTNDVSLNDFDLNKGKVALLFGTEYTGLSDVAMDNADEFLKIPMYGFTESFNISVSAALILNQLINKLHQTDINWPLSNQEAEAIKYEWLKNTIKKPDLIIEDFCKKNNIDLSDII